MAVLDGISKPPKVKDIDPATAAGGKLPDDLVALKHEAERSRARREVIQENRLTEQLAQPPEPPESPFKIGGSINLGNIDIQEQQRQTREEAARERAASQERITALENERNAAQKALNDANIGHMQAILGGKIEALSNAVASGQSKDFFGELEKIQGAAERLGFVKADNVTSGDFNAQIALKRLEAEMKREDRRFALEMKKDERLWLMELKKLEQTARDSDAKLKQEEKKLGMLAALPEQIGGAVAKGLMAHAENNGAVASQPVAPAVQQIDAAEGAAGAIACTACGTPVNVSSTAKSVMCTRCHQKFIVNRMPAMGQEIEEEEPAQKSQWA